MLDMCGRCKIYAVMEVAALVWLPCSLGLSMYVAGVSNCPGPARWRGGRRRELPLANGNSQLS